MISKFRTAFWVRKSLLFLGGLLIFIFCVFASINNGQLDYMNALFWIACIMTPFAIYTVLLFVFTELKRLRVTDSGISIRYFVTKSKKVIPFKDIKKFNTRILTSWSPGNGQISDGFQELGIELTNGQIISFNQDQFSNYYELKDLIYQLHKKTVSP